MKTQKTTITIREVDPIIKESLKDEARKSGISFNKYMNNLFEENTPKEQYKKLYEEQTHQQAVNTKVMKEMVSKLDEMYKIIKQLEEE